MGTPRSTCQRCAHHYITYDPRFPYGCQAMNFKSRQLPCKEVESLTGMPCQTFVLRAPAKSSPQARKET